MKLTAKTARVQLATFRPGEEDSFSEAREVLQGDEGMWKEFQDDQKLDEIVRLGLEELNANEREKEELISELEEVQSHKRSNQLSLKDPGMLSVMMGFLLLLGLGLWLFLADQDRFSGYDEALALSEKGAQMDAGQFEPVQSALGEMTDWFTMNGLDRFWVPEDFAKFESVGARIMRFEKVPVAQIVVPSPQMLVLVFRGQPLGISVGDSGGWKFIEGEPYSSAITERDGVCFMVSVRGTRKDVEDLIDSVRRGEF